MKPLTASLMAAAFAIATSSASAADSTVTVSPLNMNGWTYTSFGSSALQYFVLGPGTPPMGTGSAAFDYDFDPLYNTGGALYTRSLDGVYLRDLTKLKYWTYQEGTAAACTTAATLSGNGTYQPPYVQLFLDLDNDGVVDDRIAFEAAWQNGGRNMTPALQGVPLSSSNTVNVIQNGLDATGACVGTNAWWEWNLLIGSWYGFGGALSVPPGKLGAFECWADGCATIAGIVERYPNARIIGQQVGANTGGIRLQYGFGGDAHLYIGHVDKLVVGIGSDTITYNFELGPTNKDECKNGGWIGYTRNQGQCVSFFESNRLH